MLFKGQKSKEASYVTSSIIADMLSEKLSPIIFTVNGREKENYSNDGKALFEINAGDYHTRSVKNIEFKQRYDAEIYNLEHKEWEGYDCLYAMEDSFKNGDEIMIVYDLTMSSVIMFNKKALEGEVIEKKIYGKNGKTKIMKMRKINTESKDFLLVKGKYIDYEELLDDTHKAYRILYSTYFC